MLNSKKLLIISIKIILLILVIILLIPLTIYLHYRKKIYPNIQAIPNEEFEVGIVFGAGIYNNQYHGKALTSRLDTAIKLYKNNKIKKILISGDNSLLDYSEPDVMYNYLIKNGIPKEDIFMDYAGFNTYHTCLRAKYIFKINKAILISQGFHLPRALYLCQKIDINASGISAENPFSNSPTDSYYSIREILAIYKAILYTLIKPKILGGPIIPINSDE